MPWHVLLLLAAVAAGVVAQGGYYVSGRVLVTVLAVGALAAALGVRRWSRDDGWPLLLACVALSMWAVARAAMDGAVSAAVPVVLTLGGMVTALLVVRRTDAPQRRLLLVAVVGLGVLVAVGGWIGVAWHRPPWALADNALWRATSTLTYANASAALLAALSLLAIALLVERPGSQVRAVAAHLSLVGLGATLSRGGVLAFLAGLLVLCGLVGVGAVVWRSAPVIVGAALTLGGLVPSFAAAAPARPVPAVAGMVVGVLTTAGLTRLRGRVRAAGLLAAVLAGVVGLTVLTPDPTTQTLLDRRLTLDSFGRSGAAHAAVGIVAARPVIGVGPGRARFVWTTVDGRVMVQRYAHNEYLQILVELGAVGLVLLFGVLVALGLSVRGGRARPDPSDIRARAGPSDIRARADPSYVRAGAVAALVALAVHSGLDFLWQLPVIPLCAGLFAGLAVATATAGPVSSEVSSRQAASTREAG